MSQQRLPALFSTSYYFPKYLLVYKDVVPQMKVLTADFKKGFVRFLVTSPEDAWHLSQLIEEGDHLRGKTTRKVTLGSADAKTTHVTRAVTLEIVVERIEYEGSDV